MPFFCKTDIYMVNISLQLLRQNQTHRVHHRSEVPAQGKPHNFDTSFSAAGFFLRVVVAQVRHWWHHRIAVHVPTHSDLTSEKHLNMSLHGSKPVVILLRYLLYRPAQQMTVPASRLLKLRSCEDLHTQFASRTAKHPRKIRETAY